MVVIKAVAANQNLSLELLKKLANDENCHVNFAVANNQNTPPDIGLNILAALADSTQKYIRELVAQNPKTSTNILKKLTEDFDKDVRIAASKKLLAYCFLKNTI